MTQDLTTYKPQLIGQSLLRRGFRDWFKYVFRIIENRQFIHEAMHDDLFAFFQDLYDMNIKRGIINIPPRSAKTVMTIYFFAFCWAHNPSCNFIYTSYSADLVKEGSRMLFNILVNEKFKAMFPLQGAVRENSEQDPIDTFWSEYAHERNKQTNKPVFSAKFVRNNIGGIILFTQIGSAITGFAAGIRNAEGFSGGIFIDDGNKSQDIRSVKITEKTNQFFAETLLSRLNNSNAFICNIQQRLHTSNDLTAFLLSVYVGKFTLLKRPLIDNGVCLLPSQYTEDRIKELQVNEYVFLSQYQQEPILAGGNIIKEEWFCYYDELPKEFKGVYQSWDTAFKDGQQNDYSVCTTWGVVSTAYGNRYYLIDMFRGKLQYPDLRQKFNSLQERYKPNIVYIEDKASGQSIIQELKRNGNNRLKAVRPDKDKVSRLSSVAQVFSQGEVLFYENANYLKDLQLELLSFPSSSHDDIVDSVSQFLEQMIIRSTKSFMIM